MSKRLQQDYRAKFPAGAYIHHLTAAGKSALLSGKRRQMIRQNCRQQVKSQRNYPADSLANIGLRR
jgi:hypothetical protein